MIFKIILIIGSLLIAIGYQLRENTETIRRVKAEDEAERAKKELAETAAALSKSYGRVVCESKGTMPELTGSTCNLMK